MNPPEPPPSWFPRRGEVYLVRLDKQRPALILSVNALNKFALDVCIVPITQIQHKEFKVRPFIRAGDGGLDSDSWAKCDQVTTIEKQLLILPALGTLSEETMRVVEKSVKITLKLT